MTWAKLDDSFPVNVKISALSDAEFRLHVTAICHCASQLTDGFIASHVPQVLTKCPKNRSLKQAIARLVSVGLWEDADGGWVIHDYLDWNPSAEAEKAKRAARAEAGRRGGKAKRKQTPKQLLPGCYGVSSDFASGLLDTSVKQNRTPSPYPFVDPPCGGSDARDPPPPTSIHDSDRETMCPMNLALPADARSELANHLKVSEADIIAAESEFVTYWTVGGGAGKRRSQWVRKLRKEVCDKQKRGQLAGLGGKKVEVCPY